MRTAMKHFTRLDWLLTRIVAGAILLHGYASLSSLAFAQASSSDDATHVSYDNQAAVDLMQVSVTVQDGVTVQDLTYTGSNEVAVPLPALFQYGLHNEDWVPLQDAKGYIARSSGPKTIQFYDADHALNTKASVDRDDFLRKTHNLTP
jgi:hypothetical protein